jgi:DNA-binding transcriptional LysR family regulator
MPATGHGLRALIDAAAARAKVDEAQLDVVVQTDSMQVQKRLVLAGHGWTILPGVGIATDVANGTLSAAPLDEPEVWRSVVLCTPRAGRTPPGVEVVARELAHQVHSAVRQDRWPSAQSSMRTSPSIG